MLDSTLKNHNFDLFKHIANANNPKIQLNEPNMVFPHRFGILRV
jgi:hypothetical protein